MLPDDTQPTDFISNNPPCNPPLNGNPGGKAHWTYEEVQEDLVEGLRLWWRSPGSRRPPFATDGPWRLIRKEWEDWDARDPAPLRKLPLSLAEVQMRDRVSEWLLLAPEADRQLIVVVLGQLARGVARVSWKTVRERLSAESSPRGLGMRYSRALTRIAQALSKQREPRPWAGEDGRSEGLAEALCRPSRR